MKRHIFFFILSISVLSVKGEYSFRDENFGYFEFGHQDYDTPLAVITEIIDVPRDGVLSIPEYVSTSAGSENETKYKVVGMASFCQKVTDKYINTLVLNKSFRFIGIHQDGYENPNKFYNFHNFGDCDYINAIEVAQGNEYYKSRDGWLMSRDGKTLYYIPPESMLEKKLEIPDGVETVHLVWEYMHLLFNTCQKGFTRDILICPASLRKAEALFWKTKTIFLKSAKPCVAFTDGAVLGYNASHLFTEYTDYSIFVATGSYGTYNNTEFWEYLCDTDCVKEMDFSKSHKVSVKGAGNKIRFTLNGQNVSTITANPTEKVKLQVINSSMEYVFKDNTNSNAHFDDEMCYEFYPCKTRNFCLKKKFGIM